MKVKEAVKFFKTLPGERTREYESMITKFATSASAVEEEKVFLEIIDGNYPDNICYAAYYALNVVYRRVKDFYKLKDLLEKYRERFDGHITFDHLDALYNLESDALYDYNDMLERTYADAKRLKDHAGYPHLFADLFATIYEKDGLHDKKKYVETWYKKALDAVNDAIRLDPGYAKFYCTKGRIVCIDKKHAEAINNVDKAIGTESSERSDYALRLSYYQYHKMMINTDRKLCELEERFKLTGDIVARPDEASQPRANAEAAWALKNYEEGKPFVFISYSHKNSELVLSIVKMLLDRGVRVWCDVESIPMGVNYSDWIAQKIVDSKVFVLNLSSNAFVSEYVRMELGLARRRGIKMFPILLEDIELPPGVDLEINSKQRLDWFNNTDEHNIDMIVRDLPREVFVDYEG